MSVISFLDRLLFRILPGFCFLWQILLLYQEIDGKLRPNGGVVLYLFTFLFILTLATQVVWVLAGEEVFLQRTRKNTVSEKDQKPTVWWRGKFVFHALGLIVNVIFLLLFSYPENWWKFLVLSGTVYTIGTFIAEMLIVLPNIIRNFLQGIKTRNWREARFEFFLVVLMLGIYFPPVIYILIKTGQQFSSTYGVALGILSVCISRWKSNNI